MISEGSCDTEFWSNDAENSAWFGHNGFYCIFSQINAALVNITDLFQKHYRVSSPKNENSVINYSPSCRSKPVRPSFIFGTQIKIFLIKSDGSVRPPLAASYFFANSQKGTKVIFKTVHVTTVV